MHQWRQVVLGCGLAAATSLAGCSTSSPEPASFCATAEEVRSANLAFADALGARRGWDEQRSDIAAAIDHLETAVRNARNVDRQPLADELDLLLADIAALDDRIDVSHSVEHLLHESDAERPAPDRLNPALDRIDSTFESDCGFSARP